jgi:hypothetical protein
MKCQAPIRLPALLSQHPDEVMQILGDARDAIIAANPQYERWMAWYRCAPPEHLHVILDAAPARRPTAATPNPSISPAGR